MNFSCYCYLNISVISWPSTLWALLSSSKFYWLLLMLQRCLLSFIGLEALENRTCISRFFSLPSLTSSASLVDRFRHTRNWPVNIKSYPKKGLLLSGNCVPRYIFTYLKQGRTLSPELLSVTIITLPSPACTRYEGGEKVQGMKVEKRGGRQRCC